MALSLNIRRLFRYCILLFKRLAIQNGMTEKHSYSSALLSFTLPFHVNMTKILFTCTWFVSGCFRLLKNQTSLTFFRRNIVMLQSTSMLVDLNKRKSACVALADTTNSSPATTTSMATSAGSMDVIYTSTNTYSEVNPGKCRLLALPRELRDEIFSLMVLHGEMIQYQRGNIRVKPQKPTILRTCRQIRREALPLYFEMNRFAFVYY